MRRQVMFASFVLLILGAASVWAQSSQPPAGQATQSDVKYYAKTIYINKVYATTYGYIVAYADSQQKYQEIYLPVSWFNTGGGKGEIFYGSGKNFPYMNIFWRDGKFDHIALFLFQSHDDPSWGMVKTSDQAGLEAKFKNVDTLNLKY
ncbi:hypothetical protein [Salinispira pacifica]